MPGRARPSASSSCGALCKQVAVSPLSKAISKGINLDFYSVVFAAKKLNDLR